MSVLSLFHPNPSDRRALKPGYRPAKPATLPPLPKYKEPKTEEDKEEPKTAPPKSIDPNTKFIEYKVRATDDLDLWNVAATYGVRVEDIRRYNRRVVFDYLDNVIGETIYIPINVEEGDHVPKQPEADPKKIAEFKFVKDTGCSHAEAKYYLEENEWEYETAMKTFREDVSWEKTSDSRQKALQLEQLKSQIGTPTEKLVAALSPLPAPTTTTSDLSSSSSTISFPPPSYSFEGLSVAVSMQQLPTASAPSISSDEPTSPPPSWEPQMKQLKKPLLGNSYT